MPKVFPLGLKGIFLFTCLSSVRESIGLDGGFREVALDLHNSFRAERNVNPLQLSEQLNLAAHAQAEKLAAAGTFEPSGNAYSDRENIWAHFGELRPLSVDTRDATITWYSGKAVPENTLFIINHPILYSNATKFLGIGAGTSDAYTVVIGYYL